MTWYYNNEEYKQTPEDYQGFVYEITEIKTGKKYIGKKNFWRPKVLPKNSKRTRKIKTRVESDWKKYYGSNKNLQEIIEENGSSEFKRVILHLCKTKGEMSYMEAKMQFMFDVLLSDDYYNEFIGCKIHSNHVNRLKENFKLKK